MVSRPFSFPPADRAPPAPGTALRSERSRPNTRRNEGLLQSRTDIRCGMSRGGDHNSPVGGSGPATAWGAAVTDTAPDTLTHLITGTLAGKMTRTMTRTFSRTMSRTISRTVRRTTPRTVARAVCEAVHYSVADALADANRDAVDDISTGTSRRTSSRTSRRTMNDLVRHEPSDARSDNASV